MKRRQPSSRVKLDHHKVWELLNRLNMTQNELARLVGTSSGYLSQLMSGTRCPSADIRKRLVALPGVVHQASEITTLYALLRNSNSCTPPILR